MKYSLIFLALTSLALFACSQSVSHIPDLTSPQPSASVPHSTLIVKVDQPTTRISPTIYGLMTEEINHSYDGGLYAELIQNRIFKDVPVTRNAAPSTGPTSTLNHWTLIKDGTADGAISLDETNPVNTTALTTSIKLDINSADSSSRVGFANDGYWGIPVWPNTEYTARFYAKSSNGFAGPITLDIESKDGLITYATATVDSISSDWKKYEVPLFTGNVKPTADTRYVISAKSKGTLNFTLVSLFPPTYNNRPNGMRIDIVQKLADMHPAFLRFPGGNYVEGNSIPTRYNWKETIGPLEDRPGHPGTWQYRSSDGVGLLEYLEWCEDLNMQPILAVWAGYALNRTSVPQDQLAPYVQEALDEIEYVTGDTTTTWGARRAKDGHPAPFTLHYVEVGNEDNLGGGPASYEYRFPAFFDAIKAKYPDIKIIATAHLKARVPDLFDDHAYPNPRAMLRMTHRYDSWPRTGSPKIFFGEWATRDGQRIPTNNVIDMLSDAPWLSHLERNSDVVTIAAYAPLLVNVNPNGGREWDTNLIGYDALTSFGSPSYYMQKMYAENRGDVVLPADLTLPTPDPANIPAAHGSIGVGTWATTAEYKDIKVTAAGKSVFQSDFSANMDNWTRSGGARGSGSTWTLVDGAMRQTGNAQGIFNTAGDPTWTDYTISLKARKIEGTEGFMVLVHYQDRNNVTWWNVGGWGNTASGLEQTSDNTKATLGQTAPVTVEPNKWYDLRVEVTGRDIKCYLDNKLVNEATEAPPVQPGPVFAEATREDSTGQVILKIVNVTDKPQPVDITLQGVTDVLKTAKAEVLAGQLQDVNTIDTPTKVAPVENDITDAAKDFTHTFPPYSVTVIRLNAQ